MGGPKVDSPATLAGNKSLLSAVLRRLDKLEELLSVALMLVVLLAVSAQVIARYMFQAPIYWADELARYSYVWMAFIAGTFITGRRQHITINLLDNILNPAQLRWLACFAQLVVLVICLVLTYFSFEWLLKTARPKTPAMRLPMIWLYGVVWFSFVLMSFHSLINLLLIWTGRVPVSTAEDGFFE